MNTVQTYRCMFKNETNPDTHEIDIKLVFWRGQLMCDLK